MTALGSSSARHDELFRLLSVPTLGPEVQRAWMAFMEEVGQERAALRAIVKQQPEVLRIIERNGFVFDSIGREPGNWQHLAFTLYTHICEIDTIARAALEPDDGGGRGQGYA